MSLGIAFKGPEGIVLAADSRVTLTTTILKNIDEKMILPSTFDNATKLLKFEEQKYVGVVTYGQGAIGNKAPRTAHSYLPEFENEIKSSSNKRLKVKEFAVKFSEFFLEQWKKEMPKEYNGPDMSFLIGGFDEDDPYGKLFQINIPNNPEIVKWHEKPSEFGVVWGGQLEFTNRLIKGYDPLVLNFIKEIINPNDEQMDELERKFKSELNLPIPYQFLSLQDCVDLSQLLIKITSSIQTFYLGIRGVGGSIDIATITRTKGFETIQEKKITGDSQILKKYK